MPEVTPEMIADLPTLFGVAVSPDGRQVVYVQGRSSKRDEHGSSTVWVAPIDGSSPPRQFTSGTTVDYQPRWSPDGRQIAFLSDRAKRGTAQLYLIAADGGEARALTNVDNKKPVLGFAWSPGGGHIAFLSADEPTAEDDRREKERDDADVWGERWPHARLRLLSLATNEVTTLAAGNRHIAALSWSPGGTEVAYLVWRTPTMESFGQDGVIERVAITGGDSHVICRFPCSVDALTWSEDGKMLLFLAPAAQRPQSSSAVYAVPARGGEPRRIAFGDQSCAMGLDRPPGSSRPLAAEALGLETRLCWLDPATGASVPFYPSRPEDGEAELGNWSVRTPDSQAVALAMVRSAGDRPPEVWAGRSDDSSAAPVLRQISHHQTSLDGVTFGHQEPFRWTAPDGWDLDGILVRPADAAGGRALPTVVLVHGGPYGRWGQGFHLNWGDWAQWLALAGYAVLMPNPRGGFGHGERFAAAARGDVGGADYRDVLSAVDAAVERGITDPDRLGIGGWSQGGFMTAWAVTQTRRFKAGVMGAGVSDWGMMVTTSDVPDFERALGGSAPWDGIGPHRHAELSPISFARSVTTPLLILHGQRDERVPLSQAIGFHRALREVDVPSQLVVYPREPHGVGERAHQIDLLKRVRAWYDRWLRA